MATLWLRTYLPYWDRSGGRDHIVFVAGDRGACGFGSAGAQPILLSHWGLMSPFSVMKSASHGEPPRLWNASTTQFEQALRGGKWCYSPHKDVVVPPFDDTQLPTTETNTTKRRYSLVHSGGIWAWKNLGPRDVTWYSMGMRQRLFLRWGGPAGERLGIRILNHSMRSSFQRSSRWCLAPHGDGFGMRLTSSILAGCLPLIAQPFVEQPFERLLPFAAFSRRLGLDVERLPELLELDRMREQEMRAALARVRSAFSWARSGRAYEHLILALCHRAMELRGRLKSGNKCRASTARTPEWFPPALVKAVTRLQIERRQAISSLRKR